MQVANVARRRSAGTKLTEEEYGRLEALAVGRGLTQVSRWLNTPPDWLNTTHDVAGNVVKSIDPRGFATTYSYSDNFGDSAPQNTFAFPTAVTNALQHTTTTQYSYWLGRPAQITDPNGEVATVVYNDPLDRPTEIVRAAGASEQAKTVFTYNDPARIVTLNTDRDVFADGVLRSEVLYDGLGREIERRQYEGGGYIAAERRYDGMGRVGQVSNPYRPGDPVQWTTTKYDALSRVVEVQTPDLAKTTTVYSGNQATVTDPALKKRTTTTDALGRVAQIIEAPGGLNYLTIYTYL